MCGFQYQATVCKMVSQVDMIENVSQHNEIAKSALRSGGPFVKFKSLGMSMYRYNASRRLSCTLLLMIYETTNLLYYANPPRSKARCCKKTNTSSAEQ